MNEEDISNLTSDLSALIRNGYLKHAGFREEDDTFQLTKKGISTIEKKLATEPKMVLFLLSLFNDDADAFYKMLERIALLRKKYIKEK